MKSKSILTLKEKRHIKIIKREYDDVSDTTTNTTIDIFFNIIEPSIDSPIGYNTIEIIYGDGDKTTREVGCIFIDPKTVIRYKEKKDGNSYSIRFINNKGYITYYNDNEIGKLDPKIFELIFNNTIYSVTKYYEELLELESLGKSDYAIIISNTDTINVITDNRFNIKYVRDNRFGKDPVELLYNSYTNDYTCKYRNIIKMINGEDKEYEYQKINIDNLFKLIEELSKDFENI